MHLEPFKAPAGLDVLFPVVSCVAGTIRLGAATVITAVAVGAAYHCIDQPNGKIIVRIIADDIVAVAVGVDAVVGVLILLILRGSDAGITVEIMDGNRSIGSDATSYGR